MEWENQIQGAMVELQSMQEDKKAALKEKKRHHNELNDLQAIMHVFVQIQNSLDKALKANEKTMFQNAVKIKKEKLILQSGNMVQMEVDESTFRLYEMSRSILQTIFQKCTNHVETLNRKQKIHKQTVLLGWDDLALAQFSQRYFNQPLSNEEQKNLVDTGLLIKGNLFIVYEMKLQEANRKILELMMKQSGFNMYVLVNIVQAGQAQSQLKNSQLLRMPVVRQTVCNLVMQSFKEFFENGAYVEAVDILMELKQSEMFRQGEVLVNDASPLFSIMHLELGSSNAIVHDSTQLTRFIQQKMPYLIDSGMMMYAYNQYLNALINQTGVK
ncbi:hypothetical protein [Bacillus sp. T3]|uniref:hypothetical protein n=1 Tax=Bacillus sp. T3 TaxID=467262 RepID=UPI0029812E80|nr:hypothetical protein [Bacillus sp. T3]